MPPRHGLGIGVVDHRPLALPPGDRRPLVDEIAFLFADRVQVLFVASRISQAVGCVDDVRHPQNKPHVSLVQRIDHAARVRIAFLVEAKIVVASRPRAIDHHRAQRQVVIATTVDQIPHGCGRIDVVLPQPRLHRPGRRNRRTASIHVALHELSHQCAVLSTADIRYAHD